MAHDREPPRAGGSRPAGRRSAAFKPVEVVVHDRMQDGYRYLRSRPMGQDFDPRFQPDLSPPEMLALGVFGGRYMRDCRDEFPADWFEHARLASGAAADPSLNHFGVAAGTSLRVWREKGWIHPDDPRGWFQWYCRYYSGRRLADDDQRQIGRWKAFSRHIGQIRKHCESGDPFCRPRQRQALLQWGYDSRLL